jgi:hypothetical protein
MGDEVHSWLETVTTGYGSKYAKCFHDYGADTMEELHGLDEEDRERLFEILAKTQIKELHLRKLKKALARLCKDKGNEGSANVSDGGGGSAGTTPQQQDLTHDDGDHAHHDMIFTNFLNDMEPGGLLDDGVLPQSPLRERNFSFDANTMEGGERGGKTVDDVVPPRSDDDDVLAAGNASTKAGDANAALDTAKPVRSSVTTVASKTNRELPDTPKFVNPPAAPGYFYGSQFNPASMPMPFNGVPSLPPGGV